MTAIAEPYVSRTTFEPGAAYALLKRRVKQLRSAARPQDTKALGHTRVLDAAAAAMGATNLHQLNATLDRLAHGDVRSSEKPVTVTSEETPVLRILEVLSFDLTDASNATDADWLFLEQFLQNLARSLGMHPEPVCNAAAQAWCEGATWSEVQARVLRRRAGAG